MTPTRTISDGRASVSNAMIAKCLMCVLVWALAALMATLTSAVFSSEAQAKNSAWSPWHGKNTSIIIDAYAYTPINWAKLRSNKRLVGFINKASDGLVEPWRCGGSELQQNYCKVRWRRYKAEHELFLTRRALAKAIGLKWGSYHLARPGNPTGQALHYIKYADPQPDDLMALDIEHNDPKKWMSLKDAETFAAVIKKKLGRYPLLYTNHDTAKFIAANRKKYKLLSKLNLWYARYKDRIPGVFPLGHWPEYAIWQFSSMHNCTKRRCLFRVAGTDRSIDVNVAPMSVATTRKKWPFNELTYKLRPVHKKPVAKKKKPESLVVSYAPKAKTPAAVAAISSLLAPKSLKPAVDAELVIELPRHIEDKAGALVARRIDKALDAVVVAAIPTPNPTIKLPAIAKPSPRKSAEKAEPAPNAKAPEVAKPKKVVEPKIKVVAKNWVMKLPVVKQPVARAAPPQPSVYRSLDAAPKFIAAPKAITTWRTSDEARNQMFAR